MNEPMQQTVVYVFNAEGQAMLGYQPMDAPFCAGKLKPPGGRSKPNEKPMMCAVRETIEETNVMPHLDDEPLGVVDITYQDGPTIKLFVYRTTKYSGEPQSVEKLERVGWYNLDETTISQMMADNQTWISFVQRGERFTATVGYDQSGNLQESKVNPST
jgi:8-oxo-dGTP pyrophosphatase MutT (NUDIX family)